jgi:alpha/beta superfamily hydrolase
MMSESSVERLSIEGPAGPLEAVVEDPGMQETRYALLCHPHPLYGGTMENKVVTTVGRALRDIGIPTLRFNFRGVGRSAGTFDAGDGEVADAESVASWGAVRWPVRRLIIAGFSFGAFVALRLSQRRLPAHLITIAPPIERFDFSDLAVPACPWLIVQGDADEVVDPQSVIGWAKSLQPAPHLEVLPGVGHFFHGRLQDLRQIIIDAIRSG